MNNGYSPAKILMGRKLRTTVQVVASSPVQVVASSLDPQWSHFQDARKAQCENKQRHKNAFDKRHRVVYLRPLTPGEHVWVKDMNRWCCNMSKNPGIMHAQVARQSESWV